MMTVPSHIVRFGVFEADLRSHELWKQGVRVKLQEKPFQVLAMLLEQPGQVVTRAELEKRLWPDVVVDVEVGLNNAVKKLRDALGDSPESPRFVETLKGRGYRFVAEVYGVHPEEEASPTSTAPASPPVETPPVASPQRWLVRAVAAIVPLLLVVTAILLWQARDSSRHDSPGGRQSVRVLPFDVQGQADGGDYVGHSFAQAIAVRLANVQALHVLPIPEMNDASRATNPDTDAAYEIRGVLVRNANDTQANLTVLNPTENRIVWGTTEPFANADLSRLAASLSRAIMNGLDLERPRTYEYIESVTGPPEMANSSALADVLGHLRRFEDLQADSAATRLVQQFPTEPDAFALRAWTKLLVWWRSGSPQDRAELDAAVERLRSLDPDNPYALMVQGFVLRNEGKHQEGRTLYDSVLNRGDLTPDFRAWALRQRATIYTKVSRFSTAERDLREALRWDPTAHATRMALCRALALKGNYAEALTLAEQAIALAPNDFEAQVRMAMVLKSAARCADALEFNRAAAELNPSQWTLAHLAETLICVGDRDSGAAVLQEAMNHSDDPYGLYYIMRSWERLGNRQKALEYMRRAVDAGYSETSLSPDPVFQDLFQDPEFRSMHEEIAARANELDG